jgi:tetratricopeptide (TPR) repeat protein
MAHRPLPPRPAARPAPNAAQEIQGALQQGLKLQQAGRLAQAQKLYEDVLRRAPMHPDALNLLGIILCERNEQTRGAEYILRAALMRPRDPNTLNNLGNAYIKDDRHREAIDPLERAIALQPDLAEAYGNVIVAHRYAGNIDAALFYIDALTKLKGASVVAEHERARLHADLGRREEAREAAEKLARANPQFGPVWLTLFELEKTRPGDPMLDELLRAIEAAPEPSPALAFMCHAAGKAFDDLGEYDRAFSFFTRGKAQSPVSYDGAAQQAEFAAIKAVFDAPFVRARHDWGIETKALQPIFIVGMPRSGTTLAEQILSSHDDVEGAGELQAMPILGARLAEYALSDRAYPEAARALTPMGAAAVGSAYVRQIGALNLGARVAVDKLPHNFKMLGLISVCFRAPLIVHCRRDPLDTCLSLYMHHFAAAHAYNRSLEGLGHYYNLYADMMRHWHEALPAPIHTLSYEAILADQARETKALFAYAGLSWDDKALAFHKTERRVATPSQWQVRAPLYTSSAGKWRRYEKHLGPLIDALGPTLSG